MFRIFLLLLCIVKVTISGHDERARCDAYFVIGNGKDVIGNVCFTLYFKDTPRTAQNFLALSNPYNKDSEGKPLTYLNTKFHNFRSNYYLVGGDVEHRNGHGGRSIYGTTFKDEPKWIRQTKGTISMGNFGKDTNNSQYVIVVRDMPWFQGRYVGFGRVSNRGGLEMLQVISLNIPKYPQLLNDIIIMDCGWNGTMTNAWNLTILEEMVKKY